MCEVLFVGLFGVCFRSSLLDIASCKAQARITNTEREREREREYRERSLVVFGFFCLGRLFGVFRL